MSIFLFHKYFDLSLKELNKKILKLKKSAAIEIKNSVYSFAKVGLFMILLKDLTKDVSETIFGLKHF